MDGSYLQTIVHSPLAGHPTDLAIDYQGEFYHGCLFISWVLIYIMGAYVM